MRRSIVSSLLSLIAVLGLALTPAVVRAELPWDTDAHTRYAALGDSLAAGFGAVPVTQGYVYQLYQRGIFDKVPDTILANLGVPGATSQFVLDYQVPQICNNLFFQPDAITLNVGGNDLLTILNGADPLVVLATFQANLFQILSSLQACAKPGARIYMANQYAIPEIPGTDPLIDALNQIIEAVAGALNVPVADVHTAFDGRNGLLLIERHGADPLQVHPTNAGYGVMFSAFKAVIQPN
jgi:lysophospholipase L1-like esterase